MARTARPATYGPNPNPNPHPHPHPHPNPNQAERGDPGTNEPEDGTLLNMAESEAFVSMLLACA